MDLPTTVAPFILRGVTLAGIDSVMCPKGERLAAWARLAEELDMETLEAMTTELALADVIERVPAFLEGKIRGRVIVPINPALVEEIGTMVAGETSKQGTAVDRLSDAPDWLYLLQAFDTVTASARTAAASSSAATRNGSGRPLRTSSGRIRPC